MLVESMDRTHLLRSSTSPKNVRTRNSTLLREGVRVEARWNDADYWFKGVVSGCNDDGTRKLFKITYDDGDVEANVPAERIHVLSKDDEEKGRTRADSSDGEEFCMICIRASNAATMLLCDGCDHGRYHMECLDPPITKLPEGNWFCPRCVSSKMIGKYHHHGVANQIRM